MRDELGEWLRERGVGVAVVSFATPERLRPYAEARRWPFPLYADPDRAAYGAFKLRRLPWWRVLSPLIWPRYIALMFKQRLRRPPPGEDLYQGGGDFLVLADGQVPYAHRSDDPIDRPTPAALRAALAAALPRRA